MQNNKAKKQGTLRCAVVGAGIAGIASAIRLAARGHQVEVFEAHAEPGGKMRQLETDGFRFDIGPTVLTLPHLIEELFVLCGKKPEDYITFHKLDQPFRYFYSDGTVINSYADVDKFAEELEAKSNDSKESFYKYLKNVERKYNITREVFIENSLHVIRNYFKPEAISGFLKFRQIEAFTTLDAGNRKYFSDKRVVQIFNKCANYIGSNPFVAPATLNVIQHLELNMGVYLPKNGMYDIVNSLVKLAEDQGVTFHFNTKVDEIVLENNQAVGLSVGSRKKLFDRIVSNMDISLTYEKLIPSAKKPSRSLKQEKSSSCLIFYWGMNKTFSELNVHNMLFSDDEQAENKAIFSDKTMYHDPSIYIGLTSKFVKTDAPEGCENWFTMISAPCHDGQDWEEVQTKMRQTVIDKINRTLDADIEQHIISEHIVTPPNIQQYFLSHKGAVFGASFNNRFAAFLRHPNFSKRIQHLYFVGGSVHPGAGVPMSLNSAKIMDKVFQ